MRFSTFALGTVLVFGSLLPVAAQAPYPEQAQPGVPTVTMYAVKSANIRQGAGSHYSVIGKVAAGQPIQVVPVPGTSWYQLTTGGFVAASLLSPQPVVVVRRPHEVIEEQQRAPLPQYRVGDCAPYSGTAMVGNGPAQINGTACMQPDGSWKIVKSADEQPLPPQPIYVPAPQPQAVVVAPPPVIYEAPVYYGPRPIYRRY